eukprot:6156578-Ditylum_brightwellii.AAC.1
MDSRVAILKYFSGMSTKDFNSMYPIFEVGEHTTKLKWRVTNRLFLHLNCPDLDAEEQMRKKDIFVLLDMSSPNTPPLWKAQQAITNGGCGGGGGGDKRGSGL